MLGANKKMGDEGKGAKRPSVSKPKPSGPELDEQGNPLKKKRAKKPPKEVKEI